MTMLAETVDAVIGIDTHRESHEVEIADSAGKPVAVLRIGNDSAGFAQLLAAIAEVAPGPRVAVCMEGSRSYGIGLARALAAAGLVVIECEQPSRRQRRGKGKSDPIDAHLAVLAALRLDAGRLPRPRGDGDREALRILLVARQEITVAATAQTNRLRALLLAGDDTDRQAARKTLTGTARPRWLTVSSPLMPAASRPSARPRSGAWRSRWARPGASSPATASSCRSSSRTSLRPDQPEWRGTGQRRPGHRQLLPPGPVPLRGRVRDAKRHQPDPGQQRPDRPAPAQPRRGPGPEPRHSRHRADPDAQLPPDPRLRRPAHRRGKDHP